MRAIELFAGVGGFRLGLERAGHSVVWANEWDKYACDTYDKNFSNGDGGRPCPDDISNNRGHKIDRRDLTTIPATDVPQHDLIVGGFPCQAFSVAGKRRGFDETRGTLFFDILRIAKHHRTPYLLLENVKGLLNHDGGKTFEVIMRALDECGYDAQWQVLNSKNFGVPQNRERIIIIGHLRGRPRPQVFPFAEANGENTEPSVNASSGAQKFIKTRHLSQNGNPISDSTTLQSSEIPHIISSGHYHQKDRFYDPTGISPTLDGGRGGSRQSPKISISQDKRLTDISGIAPTLGASDGGNLQSKIMIEKIGVINRGAFKDTGDRALTITASYWKGHDNHRQRPMVAMTEARTEEAKAIRKATKDRDFSPRRGKILVPRTDDTANTVTAESGKEAFLTDLTRIRRLTPTECERLQAFPDNWTAQGLKPDGTIYTMSDTQRYKQMGNAVTVNVIAAVATKLETHSGASARG